jgi:hypothetical protein
MKTILEIQEIFQAATGHKPTVRKWTGSMKDYIQFKVNSIKFWDDYKTPKLKDVCAEINTTNFPNGTFRGANTIDVHKSIITNP